MTLKLDALTSLPSDGLSGTLVGRAWLPGCPAGPAVVVLREEGVFDLSGTTPTMAELIAAADPVALAGNAEGVCLGPLDAVLANSAWHARSPGQPYLLAPVDLQAIKACGVTFVTSMLERVIEEQAGGDPARAREAREAITREVGANLSQVRPGSEQARRLKEALQARGLWSQYLEVGIGPDAEVFTKAQPLSAVGTGAQIGIHPASTWNNPEPEVVLVIAPDGRVVGATLGNDVNLRDVEGRSALLLGKAKDNNASCALGPFIRLFDQTFSLDDLRGCEVSVRVEGEDGFSLAELSSMRAISRDVLDLAGQAINRNHQYPDGLVLFTGTLFAPIQDRDAPGLGFTHKEGDVVTIAAAELGALVNQVTGSDRAPPWTFGAGALMRNLAARGLLPGPES